MQKGRVKQVKFVDFPREYNLIKKDINKSIREVLESGIFVLGPRVAAFEASLAKFVGVKYAVGLASGTDSLTIALKSLNLGRDDEVIVPANVYPTIFGVARAEVKIKLCDVDPKTLNIDLKNIKKVMTKKTKAIVAVHLYGNPVDLSPIKKFAKKNKIYLIEDCAQAAGSQYDGKMTGGFGDIACFSFYPTKNLGAYGDGGAIVTNNKEIYKNTILWRMYGEEERYKSILIGLNSRLDELQAAVLAVKLKHLREWNRRRHRLATQYKKNLKGLPVEVVLENYNGLSNYHLFVIKTDERNRLSLFLKNNGIPTVIHYPVAIHLTPSFHYLGYKKGSFPVSEEASNQVLSLPIYASMDLEDVDYVSSVIKAFFSSNK